MPMLRMLFSSIANVTYHKDMFFDTTKIATFLREKCANKKLTISGGEPLLQVDSLIAFCKLLPDFNICLYTGHVLSDIPQKLLTLLNYVKVGPFMNEFKTTIKPYVGSTNQEMIKLR